MNAFRWMFFGLLLPLTLFAQQPLLSPRDSTQVLVNGKRICIDYGAPSKRGREIFGSLVPYTRWWRTGANEATSFITDVDLIVGDTVLPKGAYTLYTLPSEKQWKLVINTQTGQWGTVYNPDLDFVRVPLKAKLTRDVAERMNISLGRNGNGMVTLQIRWDRLLLSTEFRIKNGATTAKKNGTK